MSENSNFQPDSVTPGNADATLGGGAPGAHVSGNDDPVQKVRRALLEAGLEDTVLELTEAVPTAESAAHALGCEQGAIANSLIFDVGGEPLLILASGAARVNTNLVAVLLSTGKIRRAEPEFVLAHTGQQVGGVAPLGHPAPVRTVIDTSLEQYPLLWASAGRHNAVFSIEYRDLLSVTGAQPLQVR